MSDAATRPLDAPPQSWVDVYAPLWSRPYLRLARADRPIGTWLLFWPCAFAALLALPAGAGPWATVWHLILFLIGSAVMRGAGCTYNDIVDRDIDAKVARTAGRPIPSGQAGVAAAAAFLIAQLLIGLIVLLQFNAFTIWLGLASMIPVAVYPFMKRLTQWPQAVLGLAFNWGALVGWSAATGSLALAPVLLYLGCWAWTMGYDTIYAHQDKEDDALVGVGSSALALGAWTKPVLAAFYGAAIVAWGLAGWLCGLGWPFYLGLALAALHFAWQGLGVQLNDAASCLQAFRSNRDLGALVTLAILLGVLV
jgi:4-hydroxybenzoate polyprenyltransferase